MTAWTALVVGSYAAPGEPGLHVVDASDPRRPQPRVAAAGVENPSFVAWHPSGATLYAVSEVDAGALVALRRDPTAGRLEEVDRVPSHGSAPCHVSLTADGRRVHVANYASGSIAAYAVADDGTFGGLVAVHQHEGSGPTDRQRGPHAHCVRPGPAGTVHAADLGIDRVVTYVHGEGEDGPTLARLGELALDPGSGPRHVTPHPRWPIAYVVGELDATLTSVAVDQRDGTLARLRTSSTLPDGTTTPTTAAEVAVHPDGRHAYVSNRGHDSVAVLALGEDGSMEPVGHVPSGGATPRHLAVHPGGEALLVANQDADAVVVLELDRATGMPGATMARLDVSSPTCLAFAVLGR